MKKLLAALVCLLFAFSAKTQTRAMLDGYLKQVKTLPNTTEKITVLSKLAYDYIRIDLDSANFYIAECKKLSEQLDDNWGISTFHIFKATVFNQKNQQELALLHLDTAQVFAQRANDKVILTGVLQTKANILFSKNQYSEALFQVEKAWETASRTSKGQLKCRLTFDRARVLAENGMANEAFLATHEGIRLADSLARPDLLAFGYSHLCRLMIFFSDTVRLMEFAQKSLAAAEKAGNPHYLAKAKIDLGMAYAIQKNDRETVRLCEEGVEFFLKNGASTETRTGVMELVNAYLHLEKFEAAMDALRRLDTFKLKNSFEKQGDIEVDLAWGNIYSAMNQPEKALFYLQKGLQSAENLRMAMPLRHSFEALINFYKKQGQFEKATEFAERLAKINFDLNQYVPRLRGAVRKELDSDFERERLLQKQKLSEVEAAKLRSDLVAEQRERDLLSEKFQNALQAKQLSELENQKLLQDCDLENKDNLLRIEQTEREKTSQQAALLSRETELKTAQNQRLTFGIGALSLLLLLLGGAFFAFRNRQKLQGKLALLERENERNRLRDQIARDLHDEIGSSIGSIALFGKSLQKMLGDQRPDASEGLSRITQNAETSLESLRDIVWTIDAGQDSAEDFVVRAREFVQPACSAADVECDFRADVPDPDFRLHPNLKKNLWLFLKEAVANALRYSETEKLEVVLAFQKKEIRVEVRDFGIGFDPQQVRSGGKGLKNLAQRAADVGGKFELKSEIGTGTRVSLRCPAQGN